MNDKEQEIIAKLLDRKCFGNYDEFYTCKEISRIKDEICSFCISYSKKRKKSLLYKIKKLFNKNQLRIETTIKNNKIISIKEIKKSP